MPVVIAVASRAEIVRVRACLYENRPTGNAPPTYGFNTGLGMLQDYAIGRTDNDRFQPNIVLSHCSGVGEPASAEIVRAMLAVWISTSCLGVSGLRIEVVDPAGRHAQQGRASGDPDTGSVGASGDLAPLARTVSVRIEAWFDGVRMAARDALTEAGIGPGFDLHAEDCRAPIDGNRLCAAMAVLTLCDAHLFRNEPGALEFHLPRQRTGDTQNPKVDLFDAAGRRPRHLPRLQKPGPKGKICNVHCLCFHAPGTTCPCVEELAVLTFKRLIVIATAFVAQGALAQPRAAAVGVQSVEEQVLAETVPVFAAVVTARDGEVASRISGNVDGVIVLAGDRVEAGDLLIELNAELLSIRLDQSQAQVLETQAGSRTAEARLVRAQVVFDRIEALRGATSFSEGRFEDLQADLLEARSQLAEAQAREETAGARLAELQYQLDRSVIAAPFSGVVLEVLTIPGAFVQAGTPVIRLLDTSAFEVRASVPARYADTLQSGAIVASQTAEGREIELELRATLPVEDPSTRTRAVLFTARNGAEDALVAVGQSLTIDIPVGAARAMLSVPKDALVQASDGWTVFVAVDDVAQQRAVQIGVPIGDRYEVLDGLALGDLVVVRGNERLRPEQAIAPTVLIATP